MVLCIPGRSENSFILLRLIILLFVMPLVGITEVSNIIRCTIYIFLLSVYINLCQYSFGVFTLPSTITKFVSTSDWEVFVPLIGALILLNPFLLRKLLKIPDVGANGAFGCILGLRTTSFQRRGMFGLHI
jgi:hypothetical protein